MPPALARAPARARNRKPFEHELQPGRTGLPEDAQHAGGRSREAPVVLQEERYSLATRVVARDLERFGGPGIAVVVGISRQRRLDAARRHEFTEVGARGPTA